MTDEQVLKLVRIYFKTKKKRIKLKLFKKISKTWAFVGDKPYS